MYLSLTGFGAGWLWFVGGCVVNFCFVVQCASLDVLFLDFVGFVVCL